MACADRFVAVPHDFLYPESYPLRRSPGTAHPYCYGSKTHEWIEQLANQHRPL